MELKLEDLRTGNAIHYFSDGEYSENTVDCQALQWLDKDPKGFKMVHFPIPITEDILFRLGIDSIFECYKIIKNYDETFTIYLLYQGNMIFMRHIIYLHDLQNWYYHKDGMKKELKLKEQC